MIHAHDSTIVRTMSRLLIPLIQLFALYVLFFGQFGPGGGFVGGVMLGASFILGILVFGPEASPCLLAKKLVHGDGVGLMIFAGVGGLCLIGGGEFLNYSDLEIPWVDIDSRRRYLGILLTQVGVAVDITVTAISIVLSLSSIDDGGESHA
ncbi:MAG: MnhB domain-containing protein [Pirellulaceae bacterium]|jgi:multicomponent Na+:H+ antiporter subunit B|nr:MnhB domain-containing protein [Pirellulaceae bacterium]